MSRIETQKDLHFLLFGQQVEVNALYLKLKPMLNFVLFRFLQKNLSDPSTCIWLHSGDDA